jgi:putative oxidoreductase
MSTTSTVATSTARQTGRKHSGRHARTKTLLWAAQVLLAAMFAFAAVPKLVGAHSAVVMFGQIGAGQWLRYLVGTAELAGAIGLLIPRLAGLAAAGLAADMAGASIINIAVLHSAAAALTIPLCAVLALLARARWEHTAKLLAANAGR